MVMASRKANKTKKAKANKDVPEKQLGRTTQAVFLEQESTH